MIEWWAQVTVTPDERRMIVFNKGTCKGLNGWTPVGGQVIPSSNVGDSLLWKNAQKNEKKNRTSEVINKIIPHRSPFSTMFVCSPWRVPSRLISRHHWVQVIIKIMIPKIAKFKFHADADLS